MGRAFTQADEHGAGSVPSVGSATGFGSGGLHYWRMFPNGRFRSAAHCIASAADPLTLAAVAITLIITALAAAVRPALRAAAIDPIRAVRYE